MFQPLDVRGPDSRRKKLMQKLMGQAQGSSSMVPMPPRSGALAAEGRPFRAAGDFRGLPRPAVTQRSSLLGPLLARLGVVGHSADSEVSPGPGMAIESPVAHGITMPTPNGSPIPPSPPMVPGGSPISAPGGSGVGDYPTDPVTPRVNPATPTPSINTAGALPTGTGGYADLSQTGLTGSSTAALSSPVPLGNGLYYDPMTDTVIGGGMPSSGGAARRLV